MKTTLELPDDLVREIKLRAVQENRRIKDVATEALRRGLSSEQPVPAIRHRVQFPLIHSAHPAPPGQELTPERIKQILEDEDVERFLRASSDPS